MRIGMSDTASNTILLEENIRLREELARFQALGVEFTESKRKIRAVLDQTFQFIGLLTPEGMVVDINHTALHFAGIDVEDVLNKPFWDTPWWTHSPTEQERLREAVRQANQGIFFRMETSHEGADGQLRTIDFSLKPVFNDAGKVLYLLPEGRDITDIRRAEEELKRLNSELERPVAERTAELAEANRRLNEQIRDLNASDASLHRLTDIVESTSDLVATATPDKRLTYLNKAGRELMGYDAGDLKDLSIASCHPPWAYNKITTEGIPFAVNNGRWQGETAILCKDGREIDVSQVIMSHFSKSGELEYLSTIMRDISDRKRASIFLDTIINAVGDPLFVKDCQHRLIVLNRSLCEFLGYKKEQLLGKSDYHFFPLDQASLFQSKDEEVFQGLGESIHEEEVTDSFGKKRIISTKKTAFEDDTGNRYLVGVIRDITELKESERKLHNNVRFLNSIIKNLPLCIKLIASDGTILDINPAGLAMIGAQPGMSVSGVKIYQFIHQEDLAAYQHFNTEICQGASKSCRFRIIDLSGRTHTMESTAVPIPGADGQGLVQLGITRDLTDEIERDTATKTLEAQLQQAQKMEAIGNLAGGIAHDFNNILTAILGYSELVHLQAQDPLIRRNLGQIIAAGLRARDLVKQILTFSRKHQEELKPLLLQTVLHEAMLLLRASIPSSIEIVEQIDETCGPVLAVAGQIHQIIMNLCTNAYLAMGEESGRIRVSLKPLALTQEGQVELPGLQPNQYILLEVEDNGVGMPPEIVKRIFEPYFTTREKNKGTGLGLSVVHGIVSNHSAKIMVKSNPGQGARISIFFPQAATAHIPAGTISEEAPCGNERLLVVDDEAMLSLMLQQMLQQLGYNVTIFNNSLDALQSFKENPANFDLVITDMTMPHMSGDQLARAMLTIRPDLPILLCTGYSDRLHSHDVQVAGIREVLLKPILLNDLAWAIRQALD